LAPRAQFISYDNLRGVADTFLSKHHNTRAIPVPIEEIVEFDFGIDIVPMPGLHSVFDVDSFISRDMSEIRVDEFVYASRPGRYRFSLAHELSHRLLHYDVFQDYSYTTIAEWRDVISSIPPRDYGYLEWQANSLGGLILVPPPELSEAYERATEKAAAIGFDSSEPIALDAIEGGLAAEFVVSPAVVHRRLEYDKII
jgi:hypothetical protein